MEANETTDHDKRHHDGSLQPQFCFTPSLLNCYARFDDRESEHKLFTIMFQEPSGRLLSLEASDIETWEFNHGMRVCNYSSPLNLIVDRTLNWLSPGTAVD